MKKLLSLLSVLTISGTAVPTTIAASPYQKEEKLNSYINQQKNNNEKSNLSYLESNSYSWLYPLAYSLGWISIKKVEEFKDYLLEKFTNINKDYLKSLNYSDLLKSFNLDNLLKSFNLDNLLNNFNEKKSMILEDYIIDSNFIKERNFNIRDNDEEVDIYFNIAHKETGFWLPFKRKWKSKYTLTDINIEKINPSKYKYIAFFPRHNNDSIHTYLIWGNDKPYHGKTINEKLNEKNYELKCFIKNTKVENTNDSISKNLNIDLQHGSYKDSAAWVDVSQSIGLASYFDIDDEAFHLQILSGQYVGPKWNWAGGYASMGIGAYIVLSNK